MARNRERLEGPRVRDERLERRIDAAFQQVVTATSRADRLAAMEGLRSLIRLRSPQQIARMERA